MHRKFVAAIGFLLSLLLSFTAMAQTVENNFLNLHLKDGLVAIHLRPDLAPRHVERIRQLVQEGSYDNVAFHRVIDGFMAQTGDVEFGRLERNYDPARAGMGGSQYGTIASEFSAEPFKRGTLGMARSSDPDSANSQFFICFEDAPHLNGQYTVVGEVIKGMEHVDRIKRGSPEANGTVNDPDVIVKATLSETAQ